MAGKVLKMNNISKINNSAIMNKSAEKPATTHTRNRCEAIKKKEFLSIRYQQRKSCQCVFFIKVG